MVDDPLPAPAVRYLIIFARREKCNWHKYVAIILCLFLVLAVVLCPHVVFEESQSGLWILKCNSGINQAPRAVFFGALVVLSQRITLDSVHFPQIRKSSWEKVETPIRKYKDWLIMVWYGSAYV